MTEGPPNHPVKHTSYAFNMLFKISDDGAPFDPDIYVPTYSSVFKIPVRATVISALSCIPYFVISAAGFGFSSTDKNIPMGIRVVMLLLGAIRCPTIGNLIKYNALCAQFFLKYIVLLNNSTQLDKNHLKPKKILFEYQ